SNNPLSKSLYDFIIVDDEYFSVTNFAEVAGKGYEAEVRGNVYKIGSAKLVGAESKNLETAVFISKNGELLGKFIFKNEYRKNLAGLFRQLRQYAVHILSGDNSSEQQQLKDIIPDSLGMAFNQNPEDKLNYILQLQKNGEKVAMIGDGLNDAGSLKQSDIGIAVADDTHAFTPSSDVIMAGEKLPLLNDYLLYAKDAMTIVKMTRSEERRVGKERR